MNQSKHSATCHKRIRGAQSMVVNAIQ